jgi:CheY-like chemotaxis protein
MFPERILVVDDDPLVPSIARAHFLTNGVSVCDIASNGRHALELFLASESTYDLIVCDISMPEVDGIELISALHRKGYTGWLGVITSQHPTLGRTALNIAQSYGMRPAGVGRKPLDRQTLDKFLKRAARDGHARVRPAGGANNQFTVDELRKPRLDEDRVVPFYQPIVELHSGTIAGAEALARIRAEDGSIISPFAFIERGRARNGLLEPLTRSLFQAMLRDIQRLNAIHPNLNMAINWDPKLLERTSLPDELKGICDSWGISPSPDYAGDHRDHGV